MKTRDDRIDEEIGSGETASVAEGGSSRTEFRTSAPLVESPDDGALIAVLRDARRHGANLEDLLGIVDIAYESVMGAQLCILYAASHVLRWARENPVQFGEYCDRHGIGGESVEGQVADIVQRRDPDFAAKKPSRTTRGEYANAMAWFADDELCPFVDGQAIKEAMRLGRIVGIAELYKEKKRKIDQKSRTDAATRAREEQRRAKQAAAEAEMAAVAERHEQEAARLKTEKEAAVRAALTKPLMMPPTPTVSATRPSTFLSRDGAETPTGEAVAETTEEVGETEGTTEAVAEAQEVETEAPEEVVKDEVEPASLPASLYDIEKELRQIPQDDGGWQLSQRARWHLDHENVLPVSDMHPRAAASGLVQIADPDTLEPIYFGPVIDRERFIDNVVTLIEERRLLAAVITDQPEAAQEADGEEKPKPRSSRKHHAA